MKTTTRLACDEDVLPDEATLLLNAKIVNHNEVTTNDILMEEGIIKRIGRQLSLRYPNARRIDLQGRFVFPGGIDVMTRIVQGIRGDPTADDVFTATKMAIAGGTTTIIESIHCPKRCSLQGRFEKLRELFANDSCCDFSFHMALSEFNAEVEKEMKVMTNTHGINSYQFFTGYYEDAMLEDDVLYDALIACRKIGALALLQAECGRFITKKESILVSRGIKGPEGHFLARSEEMESEATQRAIIIADQACCPLVISPLASSLAAQRVADCQAQGKVVQAYCTVASISLLGSHAFSPDWREAAAHVTSPPLRSKQTHDNLVALLSKGTIGMCGSAHSQFRVDQREMGRDDFRLIPEGVPGIYERMAIVWEKGVATGMMDPMKFVNATSTMAAKMFGLYPKKGFIGEGADADLVVWNPNLSPVRRQFSAKTLSPGVEVNVYDRLVVTGGPQMVFLRGKEVARSVADGRLELVLVAGQGRYLPRPSFPPLLYDLVFSNEKKSREQAVTRVGDHLNSIADHTPPAPTKTSANGGENVVNLHHSSNMDSSMTPSEQTPYGDTNRARNNGVRNQMQSSFSLNGSQVDDDRPIRSSVRTHQPPGGNSTRLW